ncbi:MAG TPA: DUF4118 domain-containing protein [Ktedonobacterales bacterium]|jgi:PAS domain S-box-containing protein
MIGYLVAIALQAIVATTTLLLLQTFPTFAFSGVLEVLVVAFVALNWGAGPSLIATLVGALLLEFVILPPRFTWNLTDAQQVVETLLFLFAGLIISVVASQSQRARKNAEELTISLAVERAHLNAIIEAIPDVVAIYDHQGTIIRLNHAGQQMVSLTGSSATQAPALPNDAGAASGEEQFPLALFPLERVLEGETLEAIEVQTSTALGEERFVSVSAAPLRERQGQGAGAVSIMRDITTLRRNEQAVREANRQMSDFLSLASHELRTPLTGITGHLQLAQRRLERLISSEERPKTIHTREETSRFALIQEPLQRAEQQARLMNRLVGDLLDASRIQADRLTLHLTLCNLTTIVQQTVEEQQYSWPNRTIALHLPDNAQAPLLADVDRIGQVVTNYLTNALKYSPEDKRVEVCLRLEGHQARVLVRDYGPGLPASEQERIWERFHRAPGVEVQSGSGVGWAWACTSAASLSSGIRGRLALKACQDTGLLSGLPSR